MGQVRRQPPPRAGRPRRVFTAVLVLVGAFAATAASCGSTDNGIDLAEARRATVVEVVDAPASVTAKAAATLTASADGVLSSISVQPGDRVAAGQLLASIDSPDARSRLTQATEALRASRRASSAGFGRGADLSGIQRTTDSAAAAAFTSARDAAARISDLAVRTALLAQVTAAEKRYTEAAKAAAQAVRSVQRGLSAAGTAVSALGTAQRLQAQQAYDLAKSTVDSLTLRAPISGVVQFGGAGASSAGGSLTDLLGAAGALTGGAGSGTAPSASTTGGGAPPGVTDAVSVGARVTAGTPLLTVVDVSELGLVAEVDETDVLLVRAGVTADAELDAATGATYQASVRSVDVLPTQSARGGVAYRVRLSLGAGRYPDGRAAPVPRPGMSAVAHLQVREAPEAIAVPAAAVFTVDGQDSVWVVRDGKAQRLPVTVGVPGQDLVEITSGVSAGDRVVVRGTDRVRSGQQLP
jgi:HlyD family secretion protein